MKKDDTKRRLEDFLSGNQDFDMGEFVKEVNQSRSLRKTLYKLDRLSLEEAKPNREIMWERLAEQLRVRRHRVRVIWRWSIAATIMIPFLCFSVYVYLNRLADEDVLLAKRDVSKQVQLLLADGEVLDLTGAGSDTLIQKGNARISIKKEEGMEYSSDEEGVAPAYHVLKVPRGNEYHLLLPDSSEVWLNSDSELRFPSNFVNGERKVYLKGEGYFKVKKDTSRPFRVMAEELQVEVLGTCFDVNTYRDNGCLLATLVEGRVKVRDTVSGEECILKPNQRMELGPEGMKVQAVGVNEAVAWVNGCFLFSEMPLEEIAKQLERWFDIQVIFRDNTLRSHQFTGIVKRYNSLETIFSIIEETTNVKFEVQDKSVIVSQ